MTDFKPMLAGDIDGDTSKLKFPVVASPKIDGIRCIVREGQVLTRSLKLVPSAFIRTALQKPQFEGFDGELVDAVDHRNFQKTTSAVMSREGTPWVKFCVFDFIHNPAPFQVRFAQLSALVANAEGTGIPVELVPHVLLKDEEELLRYEAEQLAAGYEGVMLRQPGGAYKYGRSTVREGHLVKLKRFVDDEGEVVGFEERMHNANEAFKDELGRTKRSTAKEGLVPMGTLGALLVRNAAGVEVSVGTGYTDSQRAEYWVTRKSLLGKMLKYKHLPIGAKDKPRHPVFLGWRDRSDL
jgi:DNA ligase 1